MHPLLIFWYLWLVVCFGYYTYIAYGKSLWSFNSAKPFAKRALMFFVLFILTGICESYLK
ncbi:hypothetical protein D3C79_966580 [compost metagenome]